MNANRPANNPGTLLPGLLLVVGALLCAPVPARAVRGDFLDETLSYNTLRAHELECELFAGILKTPGGSVRGVHSAELGYGISSHVGLSARVDAIYRRGAAHFDGLHVGSWKSELRFRMAEAGEWPVNVGGVVEFEHATAAGTGAAGLDQLVPRVSLTRALGAQWNAVGNVMLRSVLTAPTTTSLAYQAGLVYSAGGTVQAALEYRAHPRAHQSVLTPQAWLWLGKETAIKLGAGIGLNSTSPKFLGRAALEFEFGD